MARCRPLSVVQPRLMRIVAVGDLRRDAHRRQHMARADLARGAGGAGADHHPVEVERDHLGLRRHAGQGERRRVGQARRRRRPITIASRDRGQCRRFEPVAQLPNPLVLGDPGRARPRQPRRSRRCPAGSRCRRADRVPGRRRGSSPLGSTLPVTTSAPIPGGPPSLCAERLIRSAPIQAASSESLPAPCTASQWKRAPCACAIAAIFGDRLDDPGLVVGEHDRNDRRARVRGKLIVRAGRDRRCPSRSTAIRSALGHGRQHRTVLDRGDEDAFAPAAEEREVVGLGAAADEHDPLGRGADQRRHRLARPLDALPRGSAPAMHR